MAIEIVDLSMKSGDFPSFFVCLPGRVNSRAPPTSNVCPPIWDAKTKTSPRFRVHQAVVAIEVHGHKDLREMGAGAFDLVVYD